MICSAGFDWCVTMTEEEGPMPMVVRKACQVVGFFLLLGVLFLGLSVLSYSPADPNGNSYATDGLDVIQNLGGAPGAMLADWALQAFGSAVALLAGMAVMGVWYLVRGRLLAAVAVAWRGLLCLAAVSACVDLAVT